MASKSSSFYIVNSITLYRLVTAPVLILLALFHQLEPFRWLLAVSFFTDVIDGFLARRFKVASILGAKLDSISDDFTVLAGIVGTIVFKPGFLAEQIVPIVLVAGLFVVQVVMALYRYGKITSFHTYGAKIAAVLQGTFLILQFFFTEPLLVLFYTAIAVTALELIEEIILVMLLRHWRPNIKGIYWVLRGRLKAEKQAMKVS